MLLSVTLPLFTWIQLEDDRVYGRRAVGADTPSAGTRTTRHKEGETRCGGAGQ